jgi:hypothetical protein
MFTKNFNSKVDCNFQRDAALIVAPDSTANKLVQFAQYQFNLSELRPKIEKKYMKTKLLSLILAF